MRWKRNPRPTGLAGVCAGPMGSTLRIDGKVRVATVNCLHDGCGGWYWVAGWGHKKIPHKNTANAPEPTEKEAKTKAMKYVRKHLGA